MVVEEIVATANVIELIRDFSVRPLNFRVTLPGRQSFHIITSPFRIGEIGYLNVTIIPVIPTCRFKARVGGPFRFDWTNLDNNNTTRDYQLRRYLFGEKMPKLTITFQEAENVSTCQKFTCPLGEDLKEFINCGPAVTLAGNDGDTTVQLRLLKIRAKGFKAMLNSDTLVKGTITTQLQDFNTITLKAFGQYLMAGEIEHGNLTALGLMVLGDKYKIQAMKESAEKYVLDNLKEFNSDKVLDIFYKLSPNVLMGALKYCYQTTAKKSIPPLINVQNFTCLLREDLKTFFSRGPTVTLFGNDGSTTVPLRLLEMRAEVFVVMFSSDTLEKRTMTIQLQDFDKITLDAFGQYLVSGEIKNGVDTALGLMVLGDKYDIQAMKESAEYFVLDNFEKFKSDHIVDTFHKISPKILTEALTKRYQKP